MSTAGTQNATGRIQEDVLMEITVQTASCCYGKIPSPKSDVGREGIICLTLPGHNPSMREIGRNRNRNHEGKMLTGLPSGSLGWCPS